MKNLICLSLVLVLSEFAYSFDVPKSIATASQNCNWSSFESDLKTGSIADAHSGGYENYGCDKGSFVETSSGVVYRFDICGDYSPELVDSVWVMAVTPSKDSKTPTETFFKYSVDRTGKTYCEASSL